MMPNTLYLKQINTLKISNYANLNIKFIDSFLTTGTRLKKQIMIKLNAKSLFMIYLPSTHVKCM